MQPAQSIAIVLALSCAYAIGVWTGPYVVERSATETDMTAEAAAPRGAYTSPAMSPDLARDLSSVPVTSEDLQAQLKPLLNRGARMDIASDGFDDAVEFASVVYAAHNTGIPFMVLKHRVLEEDQNLADAMRASKPDIHVGLEANRAQAEARSLVASVAAG